MSCAQFQGPAYPNQQPQFFTQPPFGMLLNRSKELPLVEDREIARKTEQRLVTLLFQTNEYALYALMAIAPGFWYLATLSHPHTWPTAWLCAFVGLQLCRLIQVRSFLKNPEEESRAYQKPVNLFWAMAILTTLCWSAFIVFFLGSGNDQFVSVYALVTGGIACVAISSLAHLPKIYPTYIVGMLVPVSVFHFYLGGLPNIFVGATAILFLGFGAILSRRFRRNAIRSITLELTKLKLAKTLLSENRKAEALNNSLREEVKKRESTERELTLAIEESRAASKAKSDFLAIVSHEIRTPMNGILGMLDLAMETDLDPLQRDYLDTANRSAETLLRLLNDLLNFSKSDQATLELECTAFSLRQVVEDVVTLMSGRAGKKGLNFTFTWDESAPEWVSGDPIRVSQVFGNLIGNAIKFTETGDVSVVMERYQRAGDNLQYFFKVEDTGIGINQDKLNNLFEPFTQVDTSSTRKYGGTGLGLAISQRLVRLMGGDIIATSKANEGSCFSFGMVFSEPLSFEIAKKEALDDQSGKYLSFCGRVLVVEDDPINQRVIQLLLEKMGLDLQIAENGEVGFRKAVNETWDLVLMDCRMPLMDGITATKKIRAYEKAHGLSHTPIVALTANAEEENLEACLEAGMDDFLAKPVRKSALSGVFATWLRVPSRV